MYIKKCAAIISVELDEFSQSNHTHVNTKSERGPFQNDQTLPFSPPSYCPPKDNYSSDL